MRLLYFFVFFIFEIQSLFSLQGESSYPYLAGYTFGFFCDWRLLGDDYGSSPENFNPEMVKLGDTIFVDYMRLEEFARDYLPKIKDKVIIITANYGYGGDNPMPGPYDYLLKEEKVAAWFLQNIDREFTEKLIPIPIGLASKHWPHGNTNLIDRYIPFSLAKNEKTIFMYLNFASRPERVDCINNFQKIGAKFENVKSYEEYLNDLSETVFVISPPGHGVDCHRTWEALLMGCYPVVKSSMLDPLFQDLPVVIIDDWSQVTDDFLKQKYSELKNKTWSREKLYAPYWFQKVRDIQERLRSVNHSSNEKL